MKSKWKANKAIEEHGKQLGESNALIKKYDYNAGKDSPMFWNRKE